MDVNLTVVAACVAALAAVGSWITTIILAIKNWRYKELLNSPVMSVQNTITATSQDKKYVTFHFIFKNTGGEGCKLDKLTQALFFIYEKKLTEESMQPLVHIAPGAEHTHRIPMQVTHGKLENAYVIILLTLSYRGAKTKKMSATSPFVYIFKGQQGLLSLTEEDFKKYKDILGDSFKEKLQKLFMI